MAREPHSRSAGTSLATAGPWQLGGEPARGGAGLVYRAHHALDGRVAAVKLLAQHLAAYPAARARFAREIAAVRAIRHDNVATLLDDGVLDDGRPYFAMEWLEGGSLAARLARGRLSVDEALAVVDGVAAGLAAAHAAGLVHRDLKPSNIMLAGPPDAPITVAAVRLVDFGVVFAEAEAERLTSTGYEVGTPAAMSPEQRAGLAVGSAADVYAFAVLVHELFCGTALAPPTLADAASTHSSPTLSPELPPALEPIVARGLSAEPAARGDVISFAAAVRAAVTRGDIEARAIAGAATAVALLIDGPDACTPALRKRCEAAGLQLLLERSDRVFAARLLEPDAAAARAAAAEVAAWIAAPVRVRRHEGQVATLIIDGAATIVGGTLLDIERWP